MSTNEFCMNGGTLAMVKRINFKIVDTEKVKNEICVDYFNGVNAFGHSLSLKLDLLV